MSKIQLNKNQKEVLFIVALFLVPFLDPGFALLKVKIVYLEQPYHTWRQQNKSREYALPESVLDKMLDKLEVPQLTEAHEVVYHVV